MGCGCGCGCCCCSPGAAIGGILGVFAGLALAEEGAALGAAACYGGGAGVVVGLVFAGVCYRIRVSSRGKAKSANALKVYAKGNGDIDFAATVTAANEEQRQQIKAAL